MIDENQRWLDERAATGRERDRQREPHRHPRCIVAPRSVRLSCPTCNGPVFAFTDKIGEAITCTHPDCRVELSTRSVDGAIVLVLAGGEL